MSLFARIEPKLQLIVQRHDEIEARMGDPEVAADATRLTELLRERGAIEPTVQAYREYGSLREQIADAEAERAETEDAEMIRFCEELLEELGGRQAELEGRLLADFVRDDADAARRAIVEIRAGVGGEEAALWVRDLLRMYEGWSRTRGLALEALSEQALDGGGLREIILEVEGDGAWSAFKFESGGHRVQRVPATESQGRIHTSAATVAVLPEAEEADVQVQDSDLRIDTYRASGAGGQHVNKTSSAIRVTHLPSGLVVTCQDEKSQHRNKDRALRVLRARLAEQERSRLASERSERRSELVGSGDRSDRIRTYNYPQSRVTDHRIDRTVHNLGEVLNGGLAELHEALNTSDRERRLENLAASL